PVDLGGVDKPDIATDPDQTAEDGSVTVQQAGKSYAAYQARQREEAERFDTALGIGNPDAVAEFKATAAEKMAWSEAAHQPTPEQAVQAQQQSEQLQREVAAANQVNQYLGQAVNNHQALSAQFVSLFPEIAALKTIPEQINAVAALAQTDPQ